ncbi:MAG: DUF58 domain-containing protein [Alphaproteobacteria bacterium]
MRRVKKFAEKIFTHIGETKAEDGLFASLEDLISERKNARYINSINNKKAHSQMSGDVRSVFKGRGIEFEEIRAYEYGDEVRDIDWRVTARKSAPYTRIYTEERNREIYAFLDLSSSMVFGTQKEFKSVLASKIAALLAWVCLENKDKFGCFVYDGANTYLYKPRNYRENVLAILKKISEVGKEILSEKAIQREEIPFEKALQLFQTSIKVRSTVFVISDFSDFGDVVKKNLAILANKNDVYLVDIFDRLEEFSPKEGEYMIGQEGENLVFDTRKESFKDEYNKIFVHKREEIRNFCLKFLCGYTQAITGVSAYGQIKL